MEQQTTHLSISKGNIFIAKLTKPRKYITKKGFSKKMNMFKSKVCQQLLFK